jgi:hypothetical protein
LTAETRSGLTVARFPAGGTRESWGGSRTTPTPIRAGPNYSSPSGSVKWVAARLPGVRPWRPPACHRRDTTNGAHRQQGPVKVPETRRDPSPTALRSPLSPWERAIIEVRGAHQEDYNPLRGERVAEGRGRVRGPFHSPSDFDGPLHRQRERGGPCGIVGK